MRRILSYFKNRINLWLLPLMMTAAAGSVIIECYLPESKNLYTAGFFLYSLLVFMLLDLLIRRKVLGGLVYTVLFVVILFYSMSMVFRAEYMGGASITFQQWFYASFDESVQAPREYSMALFIGGGFFMSSVVYYFTQVQYRAIGTLLILFVPFVIYAKRQDIMSDLTITLLITLYLAVMVHNRIFLSNDHGRGTIVNIAYVLSVSLFVSVSGAVSMLVPDMSSPSKLEQDADMFNFGNNVNSGERIQNSNRSTNMHGVKYTGEPIMYVYPDDMSSLSFPVYFRRRSMNAYDPETFEWYAASDLEPVGVSQNVKTDIYALYTAEKYEGANGLLAADKSAFEESFEEKSTDVEIEFAVSQGVNFVPAPLYTTVELAADSDVSVGYAFSDMFYLSDYITGTRLGRISEHIVDTKDVQEQIAEKAGMSFMDFYNDAYNAAQGDDALNVQNPEDRFRFFMRNLFDVYYNRVRENYYYSPGYLRDRGLKDYDRIKALADEIVKDCKSDYEKIKAIEGYFVSAGFEYNIDFVPSDESLSYFLFESKTGICIDFASAMTVMLIMEDIPCRYVEGYIAYEIDAADTSRLVVRDANAHAFVEAFVPYVGWMSFEPTVPGYVREITQQTDDEDQSFLAIFAIYLGRILIVIAVLFVLIFVLLFDRVWEVLFKLRQSFGTPEEKLLRLYKHISALLEYEDKTDLAPYTADLINDYIKAKTGSELREVTDLFEKNRFGRAGISEQEYNNAYECYRKLLPELRKKGKGRESAADMQHPPYI